jgi:hypothetical protein
LATFLFVLPAYAKYSGGSGTAQDPYQIATAADLIALGETPEDYGTHFILTADIDLDPNLPGRKVFTKAVISPDTDPDTWGFFQGTPFTGVFDGNGHTISHLTMKGENYLGLFGQLGTGALIGEIRNLGTVDVNVAGSGNYVGGLLGSNMSTVTQCYSTGAVSNTDLYGYVGGLVGLNGGSVTQCYSAGKVKGGKVGGLVGENEGDLTHSYSTGAHSGNGIVGGLVGDNYFGTVAHCYSISTVTGHYCVGGLVGSNENDVNQCYSTGAVTGGDAIGGLVGSNNGGSVTQSHSTGAVDGNYESVGGLVGHNGGAVAQCYSTGALSGDSAVGGLVGSNGGAITNCYSIGSVAGRKAVGGLVGSNSRGGLESRYRGEILHCYAAGSVSGDEEVGGLVGSDNVGGQTNVSFWDIQTSGQATSVGGTGKTTAEMQTVSTFLEAGWDFAGETANGTEDIWWILEGKDYPHLWWEAAKK